MSRWSQMWRPAIELVVGAALEMGVAKLVTSGEW